MYKKLKKKIGRPPMDPKVAKGTRLILRLSAAEKAHYEAQALKHNQKLSAWIRTTLNQN
jgi:hypothetical protein